MGRFSHQHGSAQFGDLAHKQEHAERDDQEIDNGIEEHSVVHSHGAGFFCFVAEQFRSLRGRIDAISAKQPIHTLAVTSPKRSPVLPDVPTFAEAGLPGFDVTSWYGVFGPVASPRDIVNKLNAEITGAINAPELKDRLTELVSRRIDEEELARRHRGKRLGAIEPEADGDKDRRAIRVGDDVAGTASPFAPGRSLT